MSCAAPPPPTEYNYLSLFSDTFTDIPVNVIAGLIQPEKLTESQCFITVTVKFPKIKAISNFGYEPSTGIVTVPKSSNLVFNVSFSATVLVTVLTSPVTLNAALVDEKGNSLLFTYQTVGVSGYASLSMSGSIPLGPGKTLSLQLSATSAAVTLPCLLTFAWLGFQN